MSLLNEQIKCFSNNPTPPVKQHKVPNSIVQTHKCICLGRCFTLYAPELHRSEKKSTALSFLFAYQTRRHMYKSILTMCTIVGQKWEQGLLTRLNLPPLSALFSTDIAAGFSSIMEVEHIALQSTSTKGNAHFQCAKGKDRSWLWSWFCMNMDNLLLNCVDISLRT